MCDCKIPEDAFKVGDRIEFDYFTGREWRKEAGEIVDIGKHGYWVDSSKCCYGTASIRCPFSEAKKVAP